MNIRKLTIGEHPKDKDAFFYVLGGIMKFYGESGVIEGVVSKIGYREDVFFKNGITKYEIWVDVLNPTSQLLDRKMWKEHVFGSTDSYFVEFDLDY